MLRPLPLRPKSNRPTGNLRVKVIPISIQNSKAAREFDLVSKAYHTLIDPQERAYYDQQLTAQKNRSYSILDSNNPHAKRARNLAVQAKWDRLVDEVLERDRQENRERQRAVFTTVSLFLSTFFLAMMRPQLWQLFSTLGRVIVLTLFVIGVWHLATRLSEYFAHYTYKPKVIQGSSGDLRNSGTAFHSFLGLHVFACRLCAERWHRALSSVGTRRTSLAI